MESSIFILAQLRAVLLAATLDFRGHRTEKVFEVIVVCYRVDPETQKLADHYSATYPLKWILDETKRSLQVASHL